MDEDIKAECVEILSAVDATSVTSVRTSSFMLERNERETVIRFIELVRKCPEIWDVTSVPYRNKLLRRRSFRKIGEELGWSYDDVVKKYNNLRTYYTKEIIKQKKSTSFQSKWPYFEQLDSFLSKTVHIRVRQPGGLGRWAMLANRTADRLVHYKGTHGLGGVRRKRSMWNASDVRHRSNLNNRAVSTTPMAAMPSVQPPPPQPQHQQQQQQQQQSALTMSTSTQVPQVNIVHLPTHAAPQQPRQSASSLPRTSSSPSLQSQPHQRQQTESQQQQRHHTQPQQVQIRQPQVRQQERQQPGAGPSTAKPISSSSIESGDTIFGRLVTSQLAKIKEGRVKEKLKISIMQQIVQTMFDDGDTTLTPT